MASTFRKWKHFLWETSLGQKKPGASLPRPRLAYLHGFQCTQNTTSCSLQAARPLKVTHASGWHSACLVIVLGMFHCYLHPGTLQHKSPSNATMHGCLEFITCWFQVRGTSRINPCEFAFENELKRKKKHYTLAFGCFCFLP